jgi:surface protein
LPLTNAQGSPTFVATSQAFTGTACPVDFAIELPSTTDTGTAGPFCFPCSTPVCIQDTSELYTAVDNYLQDPTSGALTANQYGHPIGTWCVNQIQDFESVFDALLCNELAATFNDDISSWNVSRATMMNGMFYGATSFNQDLSTWDTSSVTDMAALFHGASSFNQPFHLGTQQELQIWQQCSMGLYYSTKTFQLGIQPLLQI